MAKQSGIHGLRGKVNGMSYYSSKNGGMLVRKINEGIGQRIKDAKEFLNTRKNNAEFGACGDFAGKFIGTISQRWRFILSSIATGLMVKAAKAQIVTDPNGAWGQRVIPETSFGSLISAFNGLSKNEMPEVIANGVKSRIIYSTGDAETKVNEDLIVDADLLDLLSAIGANGFYIDLYRYSVDMPTFMNLIGEYSKSQATLVKLDALSSDVSAPTLSTKIFTNGDAEGTAGYPTDDSTELVTAFVLFRPYRTVGGEKSVLQQHCAGMLFVPTTTE